MKQITLILLTCLLCFSAFGDTTTSLARIDAVSKGLSYLNRPEQLQTVIKDNRLVRITNTNTCFIADMQYSYRLVTEATRDFLDLLCLEYHSHTETRLIITGALRSQSNQPPGAHRHSLHRAGVAFDFEPVAKSHRRWLRQRLNHYESTGVIVETEKDIGKKNHHHHVEVVATAVKEYLAEQTRSKSDNYTVTGGDTLYRIAKQHRTTVSKLASINNLRSVDKISIGQRLLLP